MNKRQKRREEWSRMVGLQEKSGQSVRVFCKERGLSEPSFYTWRQRLRSQKPVTFALVETKAGTTDTGIEVLLTSGDRLRIGCDAATLRMVLSVLRERS
jgi:hypothetical protein